MKAVLLVVAFAAGALLIVSSPPRAAERGEGCLGCHEMSFSTDAFRASTHRSIGCQTCHGGTMQAANVMKGFKHAGDSVPEQIRIRQGDIPRLIEGCRSCHQQQFAEWQAGPHGSTYEKILLDAKHNRERPLRDDCLRCHGMHFEGGIREAVARAKTDLAKQPVMPCLACHSIHAEGEPASRREIRSKERVRPSLALWDRREMQHITAARLPVPTMLKGGRAVKISPDPRQALCYQCHAPVASMQVGSGDDRTPIGVHEGLSCAACHQRHGQDTRASCVTCHPRLSNCGLDVEKMDTSFASKTSRHNIHWVTCGDCHQGKRPAAKQARS